MNNEIFIGHPWIQLEINWKKLWRNNNNLWTLIARRFLGTPVSNGALTVRLLSWIRKIWLVFIIPITVKIMKNYNRNFPAWLTDGPSRMTDKEISNCDRRPFCRTVEQFKDFRKCKLLNSTVFTDNDTAIFAHYSSSFIMALSI